MLYAAENPLNRIVITGHFHTKNFSNSHNVYLSREYSEGWSNY